MKSRTQKAAHGAAPQAQAEAVFQARRGRRWRIDTSAGYSAPARSFDIAALALRAEGGRGAAGAGASGSSDAMDEVFGNLRQIVVHHVRDAFDVNAARGDVGGDQNAIVAFLEAAAAPGCAGSGCGCRECAVDFDAAAAPAFSPGGPRRAWCGRKPGTSRSRSFSMFCKQAELAILLHFINVQVDVLGRLGGGADGDAHRLLARAY